MAGIQIDGVNNKIDFDDDLDTSISANTDDTLVFEIAGATDFTMTANTFTAASGSTIAAQALTATTVTASGIVKTDDTTNATSTTDGSLQTDGGLSVALDAVIGDDIKMLSDSAQIAFGADGDITMTHVADAGLTIATAGNLNTLQLQSNDADASEGPILQLYRNSSSAADGDDLGRINFAGTDDAGNATEYGTIRANLSDASNGSEDTQILFQQMIAGSIVNTLRIKPDEIVLNDSSIDLDFRVESNGNTSMLFVDGGNDAVAIGWGSPTAQFAGHSILQVGSQSTLGANTSLATTGQTYLSHNLYFDAAGNYAVFNGSGANEGSIYQQSDGKHLWSSSAATTGTPSVSTLMRLQTNGTLDLSANSSSGGIFINLDRGGDYAIRAYNSNNSNPTGIFNYYSAAAPDSSGGNQFLRCQDTGAVRLDIRGDGDVLNHDNAFGSLSDERIKQDIVDANSQWNDIKAIKVRNYKKKDDIRQYGDDAWDQIGVIAQELETVSPKLIRHNDPSSADILSNSVFGTLYTETQDEVLYTSDDQEVIDGDKNVGDVKTPKKEIGEVKEIKEQVKSVNYSILYMKAIKALQEAQTRIETLETKVEALEG